MYSGRASLLRVRLSESKSLWYRVGLARIVYDLLRCSIGLPIGQHIFVVIGVLDSLTDCGERLPVPIATGQTMSALIRWIRRIRWGALRLSCIDLHAKAR